MLETIPLINKRLEAFSNPRIFLTNRGGVMDNIEPYFLTTSMKKAQVAVLFQDLVGKGLEFATEAKKRGIPIVVVQHGRGSVVDYAPPSNKKLLADRICIWGPRDKEMLIKSGINEERIVLAGSPIFDGLKAYKKAHKGTTVLFAPAHSTGNCDFDKLSNMEIINILRSIKGINILVKLLSTHKNRKAYGNNVILSNSFNNDHLNKCIDAVRRSDILISNQAGTIELIAMYFNVPVIFVKIPSHNTDKELSKRFMTNFPAKSGYVAFGSYFLNNADMLPEAIEEVIKNPSLMVESRKEELKASAGIGMGLTPTRTIVKTIKELAK